MTDKYQNAGNCGSLCHHSEGQGDLVSGFVRGITGFTIWVIGVDNLLTKSP